MPVSLAVGTNSYISIPDADTYFSQRLYADAWAGASDDQKAQALIMATRAIDRQVLEGRPKTGDQALQFPRAYKVDPRLYYPEDLSLPSDPIMMYGITWWAEDTVPQAVLDACCEEALALLSHGNSNRRQLQQQGVKTASMGSVSESYAPGAGKGMLSQEARELLKTYLAGSVQII